MTEHSEGAPPPAQPAAQPSGNQTSGQQLRIAILVVVAAVVGIGLWLALSHNSKGGKPGNGANVRAIGPKFMTPSQIATRSLVSNQPIYWAGPKKKFNYEFWRLTNDQIFIRYLPKTLPEKKATGKHYLIIGTYPIVGAYKNLKHNTKNKGIKGPKGSYIWQLRKDPRSVYIVWPKVPYEVEVFDPSAAKAAAIAESGQVHTVG